MTTPLARLADRFAADAELLGVAPAATSPRVTTWQAGGRAASILTGVSRSAARLIRLEVVDTDDPAVRRYVARPAREGAPDLAFDTRVDEEPPLAPELVDLSLVLVAGEAVAASLEATGSPTVVGVIRQPAPVPGGVGAAHGALVDTGWGVIDAVWPSSSGPEPVSGAPFAATGHLTGRILAHDPETVPADGLPLATPRRPRVGASAGRP